MPKPSRFPLKVALRRAVLVVHLWLGLGIGLYFAVVGASGSVLVFRTEIDGLERPEMVRVAPPSSGAALLPLDAVIADLHRAFPAAKSADFSTVMMPQSKGGAYSVFYTKDRQALTITVNPYDGRVLRESSGEGRFMAWVHNLHINLLQKAQGEIANGYASLFAAVLLLSGLYLWWPATVWVMKQAFTIKRGASLKRLIHDLHNVTGFYTLLILTVVTLTGSALVFNKPLQAAVYRWTATPTRHRMMPVSPPAGRPRLLSDTLASVAQRAIPDGTFTFITFPTKPRQPFYALFRTSRNSFLPYASVYLDPYTGKVLRQERDDASTLGPVVMRQMSVLHFGEWGGLTSKILYALIGLTPLALFVTGAWMYIRKRIDAFAVAKRRRSRTPEKSAGPAVSAP